MYEVILHFGLRCTLGSGLATANLRFVLSYEEIIKSNHRFAIVVNRYYIVSKTYVSNISRCVQLMKDDENGIQFR